MVQCLLCFMHAAIPFHGDGRGEPGAARFARRVQPRQRMDGRRPRRRGESAVPTRFGTGLCARRIVFNNLALLSHWRSDRAAALRFFRAALTCGPERLASVGGAAQVYANMTAADIGAMVAAESLATKRATRSCGGGHARRRRCARVACGSASRATDGRGAGDRGGGGAEPCSATLAQRWPHA